LRGAESGAAAAWRILFFAQLREQPGRLLITLVAIALGVALGAAVFLVNAAALNEFGLATKRLVGEADVVVRGPREGFSEQIFVELARNPAVSAASPVLELESAVSGHADTLKVLGLDPFRAAALQPALMGDVGADLFELFRPDAIFLSNSAASALQADRGGHFGVTVGSRSKSLRVVGILSQSTYSQSLGLMDIASAQWLFDKIGKLNRVDLQLIPGTDVERFRSELSRTLPPGVLAIAPRVERDRAVSATRAYRVNLNMLALVSLWTGAFLVFSTQSLAVLRRRRSLALLRTLGLTRGQLQRALIGEGAAIGMAGSILGVLLAALIASVTLKFLSGDLGNGQLHVAAASLRTAAVPMLAFFIIGTLASCAGAWLPARSAARQAPARGLKGGDADFASTARIGWRAGIVLLACGALLCWLPPIAGLPVFGYLAVGAMLFGAVLLVPTLTVMLLRALPRTRQVVLDTAVAQLRENVGLSTLSLASIIVSFSLMVAMAIMVHSFRVSFEHWLGKLLPADLQMRLPLENDTAFWSVADQAALAGTKGVVRADFRRTRRLLLDPAKAPITLIARGADPASTAAELPLVAGTPRLAGMLSPVWISESLQDLYGYKLGAHITLPLSRQQSFTVAGVWRDYARQSGSVAMSTQTYLAATGDTSATEASLWLDAGADANAVEASLRRRLPAAESLEITTSTALRERSLRIFDRAFAITYALEAVAVIIGLTGISFAASSTALARRAEFGVLRHIGMLRRQITAMLAAEGVLTSAFGVIYGLVLGGALSLVLVFVVNRQSFNWSIDLAVPVWQLALLSGVLIAAAALAAVWSGRAATSQDALRAVREDW
jgi:putative ABC transport system permease protein